MSCWNPEHADWQTNWTRVDRLCGATCVSCAREHRNVPHIPTDLRDQPQGACRRSAHLHPGGCCNIPWWRHQMEAFSALLALCAGNSPVPVNSPHKDQWRGALIFSLICVWINGWVNNREAGDLRCYRGHYDVIVMRYRPLRTNVANFRLSRINFLVAQSFWNYKQNIAV